MIVSDELAQRVAIIIGVQPGMSVDAPIVNGKSVREVVALINDVIKESKKSK